MSEKKTMIVIEPGRRIHKEAFMTTPMTCPYCHGEGYFIVDGPEPKTELCPDCCGSGEVKAMVTIDWEPNYNGI